MILGIWSLTARSGLASRVIHVTAHPDCSLLTKQLQLCCKFALLSDVHGRLACVRTSQRMKTTWSLCNSSIVERGENCSPLSRRVASSLLEALSFPSESFQSIDQPTNQTNWPAAIMPTSVPSLPPSSSQIATATCYCGAVQLEMVSLQRWIETTGRRLDKHEKNKRLID